MITEYDKVHLSVGSAEVCEASQIVQTYAPKGGALDANVMSIVAVTAVLIVGVVVYFLSRGGSGLDLGGPFPFIAIIAIIAFVALLLRLMAFFRRSGP